MQIKKRWVDLSVFNICIVALLGLTLRSKMLFALPFINFNNLSTAHAHFAFGGWVTLALMTMMIYKLLPVSFSNKKVYQYILGGIFISSWCALLTSLLENTGSLTDIFSTLFIFITYFFAWMFIRHICKAVVSKAVMLLSISSVVCLVLSSGGTFMLAYLFSVHSLNAILYRDALFTYLHLSYNGFFTLAVFALLIHKTEPAISERAKKNIFRFAVLLCISVLPSLFLSYLWQDTKIVLRIIAIAGSILVLLTLVWFLLSAWLLRNEFKKVSPVIRHIGLVSMSAFALKMFLQSITIYPIIGNAVFGDRPMIIGFLHLVFLVFVTLFILTYFMHEGLLNRKNKFTRVALDVFASGVILNEVILMTQGLEVMFTKSSNIFPWLLWITSVWIFTGALLIAIERRIVNAETKL